MTIIDEETKRAISALYEDGGKHSNYQSLPTRIKKLIDFPTNLRTARYDNERMEFIKKYVDFKNKTILDIGGNTGFFSFEAIDAGAVHSTIIEGKPQHVEFVNKLAGLTSSDIVAKNAYLDFQEDLGGEYFDIIFNLNVVHHLGDDFGDQTLSKNEAKKKMADTFNFFLNKCKVLIFQMGYCWKGDRRQLLFDEGTKQEIIQFVKDASTPNWNIKAIGIPEEHGETFRYSPVKHSNLVRVDEWREFLNRPIFILDSI